MLYFLIQLFTMSKPLPILVHPPTLSQYTCIHEYRLLKCPPLKRLLNFIMFKNLTSKDLTSTICKILWLKIHWDANYTNKEVMTKRFLIGEVENGPKILEKVP